MSYAETSLYRKFMNIVTATSTVDALVAIMRSTVTCVLLPKRSFDVVFGVYLTPSNETVDVKSAIFHKTKECFRECFSALSFAHKPCHISAAEL